MAESAIKESGASLRAEPVPVETFAGTEDLIGIPGTRWLLVSVQGVGLQDTGSLELIDTGTLEKRRLYPSEEAGTDWDGSTYGDGPDQPPEHFIPHGVSIAPGADGVHQLLVVHHGVRESVEIFTLDASGPVPRISWRGCVLTPDAATGNAVAATADGFVMTRTDLPIPKKGAPPPDLTPLDTASVSIGEILGWSVHTGWSKIDTGGIDSMPNGIEVSADGNWIYYADSLRHTFNRVSVGRSPLIKEVLNTGVHTDNLHWTPDRKRLILAGQIGTMSSILACFLGKPGATGGNAIAMRIDPETLETETLVDAGGFPLASGAAQIDDKIWMGRIRGTVGYVPLA